MPELPEVQTTVDGLKSLLDVKITNIKLYSRKLRHKIPINIKKFVKNSKIQKIYRIGKYIIVENDKHYSIIFHLGMSGRLKIENNRYKKLKHDHVVFNFNNKKILIFNDQRKFGFLDLVLTKNIRKTKYINKLGIDPFDKKLNSHFLSEKLKNSIVPIKQILLDQTVISGIGNIYASEILFDSKISPFIPVKNLTNEDFAKIIISTRKILRKAIKSGGTSIRDYRSVEGIIGNFQNNFKVYNKENKKIKGFRIKRAVQYGRSTFYCPEFQNVRKITK